MKKISALFVFASVFFTSNIAQADNHSVTLGYAQSMVKEFKHIKGVNAQYRYEWGAPFSIIGSMTYMAGSAEDNYQFDDADIFKVKDKADVKYWSLLTGPAYRFTDYISAYALAGVSHTNVKNNVRVSVGGENFRDSLTESSNNFAYGAGVIINPMDNLVVTAGYEGSKTRVDSKNYLINGFNVGIGYRF